MEFDKIIPHIGGFGRCHRTLAAFACLPNLLVALSFSAGAFFALTPRHHCRPDPQLLPEALRNLSGVSLLNHSLPRRTGDDEDGATGWSRCRLLHYPSARAAALLPNGSVACTRGWRFEPSVGLETNVVTQWNLVCQNKWKVPLEQVGYSIGWTVGFLTLGTVVDGLGRRSTFILSVVVAIIQHIGVLVSVDFLMLLIFHMLSGVALAGLFLSAYVARLEMCDPPHRLMIMMVAAFCTVAGELLLPGLAEMCKNWRILQGVVTTPFLILLLYWCIPSMFPESPRWLLATRQIGKCKQILQGIAIGNGVNVEDELYTQCMVFNEMDSVFEEVTRFRPYTFCDMTTARTIWKNILILGFTTGATLGLVMATGFIGKATSPIMDLHNKHGFFLHHVVFASFAVLSVLCIMLLPESKWKPLPESLKDGEYQRRPPLLLSQNKDRVPLLHSKKHSNYNPENYSKLVTATKKMVAHNIPIQSQVPARESVTKKTKESAT
ncbi:putative solute carrier family 22 member 31 isoform X4 [Narcine bancroftii]|uniref:putative solute carrier family 22 member 31 isoform X4 n=1 Tax=Narcine bancroftii TaxID=1343680 RepID=UPI0038312FD2